MCGSHFGQQLSALLLQQLIAVYLMSLSCEGFCLLPQTKYRAGKGRFVQYQLYLHHHHHHHHHIILLNGHLKLPHHGPHCLQ